MQQWRNDAKMPKQRLDTGFCGKLPGSENRAPDALII
jgi:hypothetical protein